MRNLILLPLVALVALTTATRYEDLIARQKQEGNTTTGSLGDAQTVEDNPIGAVYVAELPDSSTNTVRGSVVAQAQPDGKGVLFQVSVSNMPSSGGPFCKYQRRLTRRMVRMALLTRPVYHIHAFPVPSDGNCTGTLAHLDPYIRGEMPVCDSTQPATCQVGDLSGKYGKIDTQDFSAR